MKGDYRKTDKRLFLFFKWALTKLNLFKDLKNAKHYDNKKLLSDIAILTNNYMVVEATKITNNKRSII